MIASIVVLIVMGILLLSWVILCFVLCMKRNKKIVENSDFDVKLKCEKCGMEYTAPAKDITKTFLSKSKSVTKTKLEGPILINKPKYSYYSKKFFCPNCNKMEYAKVLNIDTLQEKIIKSTSKSYIKCFVMMIIGGLIILILTSIPMTVLNKMKEDKIKDLKDKQYEQFLDDYNLN